MTPELRELEVRTGDGFTLSADVAGEGPTVLLLHGFASTRERNWHGTGWTRALVRAGFRVVAYDHRGHGASRKSYDPADYAQARLLDDAVDVLDATGTGSAAMFGYSMGGVLALGLAVRASSRVGAVIASGVGDRFFPWLAGSNFDPEPVARALEAPSTEGVARGALAYRRFAESLGQDLRALAACWRRERTFPTREELATIDAPVLFTIGERDAMAGSAEPLAHAVPDGRLVVLAGKDHTSAVGAREHREAAIRFLEGIRDRLSDRGSRC